MPGEVVTGETMFGSLRGIVIDSWARLKEIVAGRRPSAGYTQLQMEMTEAV